MAIVVKMVCYGERVLIVTEDNKLYFKKGATTTFDRALSTYMEAHRRFTSPSLVSDEDYFCRELGYKNFGTHSYLHL